MRIKIEGVVEMFPSRQTTLPWRDDSRRLLLCHCSDKVFVVAPYDCPVFAGRCAEYVLCPPLMATVLQAAELDGEKDAAVMEGCLLEEDLAAARAEAVRLTRLLDERGVSNAAVRLYAVCSPSSSVCACLWRNQQASPSITELSPERTPA